MTQPQNPSDETSLPPVRQRTRSNRPLLSAPTPTPSGPPDCDASKAPVRQRKRTIPEPAAAAATATATAKVDDYEVGYGKPPKHSQFKAGHDPRRPRGRKPGSKNEANIVVEMMESPTIVRTPEGGVKTISTAQAMARKLRELGLSGHFPALVKSVELYLKALPPSPGSAEIKDHAPPKSMTEVTSTDLAILSWYEGEVLSRNKNKKTDK